MPHLHDEDKANTDDASQVSACPKSVDSGSVPVCPVAESAANKLLSLAAMAEDHAKRNAEPPQKETEAPQQVEGHCPSPSVIHLVSRPPPFVEDSRQQLPPPSPGMGPRWGVVSHHPRFHGFVMNRMYPGPMSGPAAGGSPVTMAGHPMRHMRRGGGRGGFPVWTVSPRPPYRPPPHHKGSPSPLLPSFRSPFIMTRQSSSNDDDSSASSGRGGGSKRPSVGYPTKSILKKPRVETPTTASSSETSSDPSEEDAANNVASRESSNYPTLSKTVSTGTDCGASSIDIFDVQTKTTIESVVVEKSSLSSKDDVVKRQRIISPASSNEYQKSDHDEKFAHCQEGSLSPEQRSRRMSQENAAASPRLHYQPPPVHKGRPPHPPVQGIQCGPHRLYMPPGPMYPHRGVRPFPQLTMPAVAGPGMYPPRSMSSRGRPAFVAMQPFYTRARMDASPSPSTISPEQRRPNHHALDKNPQPRVPTSPVTSTIPPRRGVAMNALNTPGDASGSANRCIPLTPPVPSKYWSDADTTKDVVLPDFHRLVNFPDLLVKGRNVAGESGSESVAPNALSGKKRCVMCGQLRVSATYVRTKKAVGDDNAESPGNSSGTSNNSSDHIIPRQNKGVCTSCDVTVWVALELDGLEIKWCKG